MLFVSGTRDRLAPLERLRPLVEGLAGASLEVVEEGDHSFEVPKRMGLDPGAVLDHLCEITAGWVGSL